MRSEKKVEATGTRDFLSIPNNVNHSTKIENIVHLLGRAIPASTESATQQHSTAPAPLDSQLQHNTKQQTTTAKVGQHRKQAQSKKGDTV